MKGSAREDGWNSKCNPFIGGLYVQIQKKDKNIAIIIERLFDNPIFFAIP